MGLETEERRSVYKNINQREGCMNRPYGSLLYCNLIKKYERYIEESCIALVDNDGP